MQIPILIEPIEGERFRARAGEPFAMSAEGGTKLEASRKLEEMILARVEAGAELVVLDVPVGRAQALTTGLGKDNPLWADFLAAIAENRRREDDAHP